MAAALGSSPRARERGPHRFDLRDFGARPGPLEVPAARLNGQRIQQAIDTAAAHAATGPGAIVFVPAGTWTVARPLCLDADLAGTPGLRLVGEGPASQLVAVEGHHALVIGVAREVPVIAAAAGGSGGARPAPAHAVDLFGRVDATMAPAPGVRFGLRTLGHHHLVCRGTALDTAGGGDWPGLTSFTLTLKLDLSFPNPPGALFPIAGLTDAAGRPAPWRLSALIQGGPPLLFAELGLADEPGGSAASRLVLGVPLARAGINDLALQLDLDAGVAAAFVDGRQVAASVLEGRLAPGARLATAGLSVLGIGSCGPAARLGDRGTGQAGDFAIYGLKLSRGLRYRADGPGRPMVPLDPADRDDLQRYVRCDDPARDLAALALDDPPAALAADRAVRIASPAGSSTGWWLDGPGHADPRATARNVHVRDLTVRAGAATPGQGAAIVLGRVDDIAIVGVRAIGGCAGLGTARLGRVGRGRIVDCQFGGGGAAIEVAGLADTGLERIAVEAPGRVLLRAVDSVVPVRGLRARTAAGMQWLAQAEGSALRWSDVVITGAPEGGPARGLMAIGAAGTEVASLELTGCDLGPAPTDGPLLRLTALDASGAPAPCRVAIDGLTVTPAAGRVAIETRGSGVRGRIALGPPDGPEPCWLDPNAADGPTLTLTHPDRSGPPRAGAFVAEAHEFFVSRPAPGRPRRYRCVRSGAYGTAMPPEFVGVDPVERPGHRLAVDLIGHGAATAGAGAPRAGGGHTDAVHLAVLRALLSGAPLPPLPGLWADLASGSSGRVPVTARLVGGGLAELDAVTIPVATGGAVTPAGPLRLWDRPGPDATPIARIDLDPIRLAPGSAGVAIGAGVVRFAPAPPRGGGFAPGFEDEVAAWALGGRSLAGRPLFLALSTAPARLDGPPAEPPGGGYARRPTTAADWAPAAAPAPAPPGDETGWFANRSVLDFPAPRGDWGTVRSLALLDAADGGAVVAAADLVAPRTIAAGDPAPGFDPGACRLTRS